MDPLLDLSSSPIRIDRLEQLSLNTLLSGEEQLFRLAKTNGWARKQLALVQQEIAKRRVYALLLDGEGVESIEVRSAGKESSSASVEPIFERAERMESNDDIELKLVQTSSATASAFTRNQLPLSPISAQQAAPLTSFVTSSTVENKDSFRARAKAASRSRKARVLEQSEEYKRELADKQRNARRQQIMQRMEERRELRRRAEQVQERRRLREQQRKAERAQKLEEEMKQAAELAKAKAEFSGKTPEEAVREAAAAAASLIEAESDSDESLTAASVGSSKLDSSCASTAETVDVDNDKGDASIWSSPDSCVLVDSSPRCDAKSSGAGAVGGGGAVGQTLLQADTVTEDKGDNGERGLPAPNTTVTTSVSDIFAGEDSSTSSSDDDKYTCGDESFQHTKSSDPTQWNPSLPAQTFVGERSTANDIPTPRCTYDDHAESSPGDLTATSTPTEQKRQTVASPKRAPASTHPSFASVYPHFWCLFTAFAREPLPTSPSKKRGETLPRPTTAIKDLLKHQVNINEEFLQVMADYLELQNTSIAGQSIICPSIDRFVKIGSARPDVAILISDVLTCEQSDEGGGWRDFPADLGLDNCWNLLWTWSQPKLDVDTLMVCQKVNRFKGTRCLTRKDLLKNNIQRFSASSAGRSARGSNKDLDLHSIMPLTFVLPQEYNAFAAAFSAIERISGNASSNFWISKPIGLSRGRGITVINDIGDVAYSQPIVMQKYLMNPFLFKNYKFDLRLYVLVTQFGGLEAFIYAEGLARFASKLFTSNPESIYEERVHLTNSSIQKEYCAELDSCHPVRMAGADGGGNKIRLTWLLRRLEGQGVDTKLLWSRIKELCLKTLLVVDGNISPQPNAFEVFGFDVILTDEGLKPLLIEVNACPALARDSDLDSDIKESLIRDTIALVDPPAIDREALARICNRRLGGGGGGGGGSASTAMPVGKEKESSNHLEKDLREIFMGRLPRQYGELPQNMGAYERLAPGQCYDRLMKGKG